MKHFFISIMAIICLLMASSSADAQLIIRNNGHAEIGVNPFEPLPDSLSQYSLILDTVTVFKLFGAGPMGAGARMSFGDNLMYHNFNVMVGEYRNTDTDQLWLHGKHGFFLTSHLTGDTIMYYDTQGTPDAVRFKKNVQTTSACTISI